MSGALEAERAEAGGADVEARLVECVAPKEPRRPAEAADDATAEARARLAEGFVSPRFLECSSLQAPEGEEGLYLGFSHLHSFLASLLGFVSSGFLLEAFCPDPRTLSQADQLQRTAALAGEGSLPDAYAHAHYIWFVFVGVAFVSAVALVIYGRVANTDDPSPLDQNGDRNAT